MLERVINYFKTIFLNLKVLTKQFNTYFKIFHNILRELCIINKILNYLKYPRFIIGDLTYLSKVFSIIVP